jgi:hypothetical protein
MSKRFVRTVLAAVVALAGPAAAAQADSSIVYVGGDGNVWLANGHLTRTHRVTHNGARGYGGYFSTSEADNGTIVAERDPSIANSSAEIIRVNTHGQVLSSYSAAMPSTQWGASSPPIGVQVSPNGQKVSFYYTYQTQVCLDFCTTDSILQTVVSDSNQFKLGRLPEVGGTTTWMGNGRLLILNDGPLQYYDLAAKTTADWFSVSNVLNNPSLTFAYANQISADGHWLAVEFHDNANGSDGLLLFTVTNAYGGTPPGYKLAPCAFISPTAGAVPSNVSWSPDDRELAFQFAGRLGIFTIPTNSACTNGGLRESRFKAASPFWSAATYR